MNLVKRTMDPVTRLILFAVVFSAIVAVWALIYTKLTGKPFIVINPGNTTPTQPERAGEPVTLDLLQGQWRMTEVGKSGNFAPI